MRYSPTVGGAGSPGIRPDRCQRVPPDAPHDPEAGAAWWVVLVVVVLVVLVVALVVKLFAPSVWCGLDPPCAPPSAEALESRAGAPLGTAPEVRSVEIVPGTVFVERATSGNDFALEARLRDGEDYIIPAVFDIPVTWSVQSPLAKQAETDRRVVLSPAAATADLQATVTVKVAVPPNRSSTPATISVRSAPAEDLVVASHTDAEAPSATLADVELKNGTLLSEKPMAFVRVQPLGDVKQPGPRWGAVAIISPSRPPVVQPPPTALAGTNVVIGSRNPPDGDAVETGGALLEVEVAIWVAVPGADLTDGLTAADVAAAAIEHLAWANDALARARAGLRLVAVPGAPFVITDPDVIGGVNNAWRPQVPAKQQDLVNGPAFLSRRLNVYYVGRGAPEGLTTVVTESGGAETYVACVGWRSHRSVSTLAHESGHALGLGDVTYYGKETPFSAANVMGLLRSDRLAPRDAFTVGQVFRMVAAKNSWLTMAGLVGWTAVDCSAVSCPAWELDLPATPRP